MTDDKKQFDFDTGFASVTEQEQGVEVQIMRLDGTDSGMRIVVAGPDSERRRIHARRVFDQRMSRGLKKMSTAVDIEAAEFEEWVAATISWRFPEGFTGPKCTPEEVRNIYKTRPYIYRQVRAAGDDLVSFATASTKH